MILIAVTKVVIGHVVERDISWWDHSCVGLVKIYEIIKLVCSSLAYHQFVNYIIIFTIHTRLINIKMSSNTTA